MGSALKDFREQYPQYNDVGDEELAEALRTTYYADADPAEYRRLVGLPEAPKPPKPPTLWERVKSTFESKQPKADPLADKPKESLDDFEGTDADSVMAKLKAKQDDPFDDVADEPAKVQGAPLKDQFFAAWDEYRTNRANKSAMDAAEGLQQLPGIMRGEFAGVPNQLDSSLSEQLGYRKRWEKAQAGDQGAIDSLNADTERARQKLGAILTESVKQASMLRDRTRYVPYSSSTDAVLKAKTFGEVGKQIAADPVTIISELAIRSAPNMVESIPLALAGALVAGPVGMGVGVGLGSGMIEYRSAFGEYLAKRNVNLDDPNALLRVAEDPQLMAQAREYAAKRSGIVTLVDTFTGGFAGKTISLGAKTALGRELVNAGVQTTVQAAGGAIGETGAQLATLEAGETIRPGEIAAEVFGEMFTAPIEVGTATVTGIRAQAQQQRLAKIQAELNDILGRNGPQTPPSPPSPPSPEPGGETVEPDDTTDDGRQYDDPTDDPFSDKYEGAWPGNDAARANRDRKIEEYASDYRRLFLDRDLEVEPGSPSAAYKQWLEDRFLRLGADMEALFPKPTSEPKPASDPDTDQTLGPSTTTTEFPVPGAEGQESDADRIRREDEEEDAAQVLDYDITFEEYRARHDALIEADDLEAAIALQEAYPVYGRRHEDGSQPTDETPDAEPTEPDWKTNWDEFKRKTILEGDEWKAGQTTDSAPTEPTGPIHTALALDPEYDADYELDALKVILAKYPKGRKRWKPVMFRTEEIVSAGKEIDPREERWYEIARELTWDHHPDLALYIEQRAKQFAATLPQTDASLALALRNIARIEAEILAYTTDQDPPDQSRWETVAPTSPTSPAILDDPDLTINPDYSETAELDHYKWEMSKYSKNRGKWNSVKLLIEKIVKAGDQIDPRNEDWFLTARSLIAQGRPNVARYIEHRSKQFLATLPQTPENLAPALRNIARMQEEILADQEDRPPDDAKWARVYPPDQDDAQTEPAAPAAPPAPYTPDPRLKRASYRSEIQSLAAELIVGGGVTYTHDENGAINGRTSSGNPTWFQSMMEIPSLRLSVKQLQKAVEKAVTGKKLGVREARVIRALLDMHTDQRTDPEQLDMAREDLQAARARRREARGAAGMAPDPTADLDGEQFAEDEYPPEWDAETRQVYEAMSEARLAGVDPALVEQMAATSADSWSLIIQLEQLTNERGNQTGTDSIQTERSPGTDTGTQDPEDSGYFDDFDPYADQTTDPDSGVLDPLRVESGRVRRPTASRNDAQLEMYSVEPPVPTQANAPNLAPAKQAAVEAVKQIELVGDPLALVMSNDFAARQRVSLVGQRITSFLDLATLAQIYRDPRFETLRFFFLDAEGNVLDQLGFTTRLPASGAAWIGASPEWFALQIEAQMLAMGATSFYMMHNHPSGESNPSNADLRVTTWFGRRFGPKFKGQVVIDTDNYSIIKMFENALPGDNAYGQRYDWKFQGQGQLNRPVNKSPWNGEKVKEAGDLADYARGLLANDSGDVVLILLNSQHRVLTIRTLPKGALSGDYLEMKRVISRILLQHSSPVVYAVSREIVSLVTLGDKNRTLVSDGLVINADGSINSMSGLGLFPPAKSRDLLPDRHARLTPDSASRWDYLREGSLNTRRPSRQATGVQAPTEDQLGFDDVMGAGGGMRQAIANEIRRRDEKRNRGQRSVETGDPTDLFSQAQGQQGLFDTPQPTSSASTGDLFGGAPQPAQVDLFGSNPEPQAVPVQVPDPPVGPVDLGAAPFARWFMNSRITDDEGRPLRMYHGARPGVDIESFDTRAGAYFTPDPNYAEGFTDDINGEGDQQGAIYPVYLRVLHPFIVKAVPGSTAWERFVSQGNDVNELRAEGYDAAMLIDSTTGELDQVFVLDPPQIKSAIGNIGTYDPDSDLMIREEKDADITTRREQQARVAAMDMNELIDALYQDDLTKLGNERAYSQEGDAWPAQITINPTGLKWIVDRLGDDASDATVVAVAEALDQEGVRAWRLADGSFRLGASNQAELDAALVFARGVLAGQKVTAPKGSFTGIALSVSTAPQASVAVDATVPSNPTLSVKGSAPANMSAGTNYVPIIGQTGALPIDAQNNLVLGNGRVVRIPKAPVRREHIMAVMVRYFGNRIYLGRVKGKGTLGFYRPGHGGIRLKRANDIEVAAHELAHYLDDRYPWIGRLVQQHKKELLTVSYDDAKVWEGFAEFMRLFFTQESMAMSRAPAFYEAWRKALQADARLESMVYDLQELMHAWTMQGARARGASKMGSFVPSFIDKIRELWPTRLAQDALDGLRAVRKIEAVLGTQEAQAYQKLRLAMGGSNGVLEAAMFWGTPGWREDGQGLEFTGESLLTIFGDLWGDHDLGMYMLARRAAELSAQGRENLMRADEIAAWLAYGEENPDAAGIWARYQAYNSRMLDFAEGAGVLSAQSRQAMEDANKNYVPFYRVVEAQIEGRGAMRGGNPFMRLKGGTQNVAVIWDNIVQQNGLLIRFSMMNDAKRALLSSFGSETTYRRMNTQLKPPRALESNPLAGTFAMKITGDTVPVKIHSDQLLRKIVEAAGMTWGQYQMAKEGMVASEEEIVLVQLIESMEAALEPMVTFFMFNQDPMGNVDYYLEGGEKQWFEIIDPGLWEALQFLGPKGTNLILAVFGAFSATLRRGVVAVPVFQMKNFLRDTVSAWLLSSHVKVPAARALRVVFSRMHSDPDFREMVLNGGGFSSRSQGLEAQRHLIVNPLRMTATYDRFMARFENANRLAEYKAAKAGGVSPRGAAFLSREISTDFAMRGASAIARFLAISVPFLNARAQGGYRNKRQLDRLDHATSFAIKGMALMTATLALYAINKDDDRYEELPDDIRDLYWVFFTGAGEADYFLIPKPFEVGQLWGTIPERIMEYTIERDGKEFGDAISWMMLQTFALDMTPQTFQPLIDLDRNRDFTGAPIVPFYLEGVEPSEQFQWYTSETMKDAGRAMNISPIKLEHAVRGYLGTMGTYALAASDAMIRATTDDYIDPATGKVYEGGEFGLPPSRADSWKENLVVKALIDPLVNTGPPRRTESVSDLYDMAREVETVTKTIAIQQKRQSQDAISYLMDPENQLMEALSPMMTEARQALTEIKNTEDAVRADRNLGEDEKRNELWALARERNEYARQVMLEVRRVKAEAGMDLPMPQAAGGTP